MIKPTAQGTIEYLVIMAIVIIIGLLVISLTSNFWNSDIGYNISKTNQLSNSISVSEVVVDGGGKGIIQLTNNSGNSLTITKIETASSRNDYEKTLGQGDDVSFYMNQNGGCECDGTVSKQNCVVDIYVTSRYGIQSKQTINLQVDCVVEASTPTTLTKPYPCADYTKDWVIDADEISNVLAYWRSDGYHLNPITSDGYAPGPGSHDGPYHCSDTDQDWYISDIENEVALDLWRCVGGYDYNFVTNDWNCV